MFYATFVYRFVYIYYVNTCAYVYSNIYVYDVYISHI